MDEKHIEKAVGEIKDILMKNFSTSRKLTEGDTAFQQYAMENKDRTGESTPPINIQEPPISKAGISTMAPKENIGENNSDKEIQYDNPVDKVEKDYARHGLGAFSTQHMIPGEMSNQVGYPEKVDAVAETKRRTLLTANKEPFCEKMEKDINSSLKKSINSWFVGIDENTSVEKALVSLRKSLKKWNSNVSKNIIMKSDSTSSSLYDFTDGLFKDTAEIVKSYPMGSYAQKKAIDSIIKGYILKVE